jgi:hypothetical protein
MQLMKQLDLGEDGEGGDAAIRHHRGSRHPPQVDREQRRKGDVID